MSKITRAAKPGPVGRHPPNRAGRGEPEDVHLWTELASSVRPLKSRTATVSRSPKRSAPRPHQALTSGDQDSAAASVAHVARGESPLRAAPSHKVIEPGLRRKIARGRESIDATLDLHGMRQADAHRTLIGFIGAASARGHRNVLVITGKGAPRENAQLFQSHGVLRQVVPRWLAGPELAPLIAGTGTAARGHGGEGAIYVRLKKARS